MHSASTYLAPEHHRRTLPEALVGFASPVANHPLEGGVLGEHEQDADDDADDKEKVESGVLVEVHRLRFALQLPAAGLVGAPVPLEVLIAQVVHEAAVLVLQYHPRQLRLSHVHASYIIIIIIIIFI